MKFQGLLFVALFAVLAVQVQAQGYEEYKEYEHEFPDTCEELFKTNDCNQCEKLMWKHFQNPGECATAINLGKEIFEAIKDSGETPKPYDLKFFKKGLTSYCHKDFHCSQNQAEEIYKEVQYVCAKELSVEFDWSAHPKTYTDLTAYSAYGTLLVYYTGIPSRHALCAKSKRGGFCSYEFTKKFVAWMKEETDADPMAIVTHDQKFVIKGDGTKIRIPKYFQCDPCWKKMAKFYYEYIKEHRLKKSVEENIWGTDYEHELPQCHYNRGLAEVLKREESESGLNKRSPMPSFGVLGSRDLHPLSGLL